MTVTELLAKVDSRELTEWLAYAQIEPFGDEWRPIAQLSALTAACHGAKDVQAEDYMLIPRRKQEVKIDKKATVVAFKALAAATKGKGKKK